MLTLEQAKLSLIICIGILVSFGLVMLYSATSADTPILIKQCVYIVGGISIAAVIRKIDYRIITRYWFIYIVAVALPLIYLAISLELAKHHHSPLPLTRSINGAFRWLIIGNISLQPSEFAKIAIIIYLANYYSIFQKYVLTFWRGVFFPFLIPTVVIGLIFLGKNLSITIIGVVLMLIIAFVAGVRLRYLLLLVCLGVGVLAGDYYYGIAGKVFLPEYRVKRLTSFQNPEASALGDGYQLYRSQLALGAGGTVGRGYSNSILKHKYIPEKHTDFIAAVIGEEFGFLGTCGVIFCFLAFAYIGYSISANAIDYEGGYLAAGLTSLVLLHAFVNLSVVSGLGPTTGLTAPFLSYGGSSIIANFIGIGLLLSIVRTSLMNRKERLIYN